MQRKNRKQRRTLELSQQMIQRSDGSTVPRRVKYPSKGKKVITAAQEHNRTRVELQVTSIE